jgi:hypothetical protein
MAIQRKQFHDVKKPTGKPVKKVKNKLAKEKHKKSKKKSTSAAIVDKHVIQSNSSNKSFPKSKLVSALFNDEDNLQSAFDGEFKLSRDHVEQLNIIVNTSQIELKQALFIIYENKGYEALGCDDFKAYVKKYLTLSYDAALKQALAAKVAYVINGLDAIGFYSDNSMLPMKDLSDVQIKNVVEQIEEEHDMDITIRGKYTRKMVEAAMRELDLLDDIDDVPVSDRDDDQAEDEELDVEPPTKEKQHSSTPKTDSSPTLSNSLKQFLKALKKKTAEHGDTKAIFTSFIETNSGKNPETVKKAIKLLSKHLKTLEA